eukprot:2934002-Amphidinium_carterae.1
MAMKRNSCSIEPSSLDLLSSITFLFLQVDLALVFFVSFCSFKRAYFSARPCTLRTDFRWTHTVLNAVALRRARMRTCGHVSVMPH